MYNCYASALRWNKSPIKCTACGDAEKFLLVGSPLVAHPHASFPQLPGPLKQLTSQRQSTSLFNSGCHVMPSQYVFALRCVPSQDREEYENKSQSLQSAKVEPCLFEVHNKWTVALNITREILNCWTRGEKVSHSSGGCHTVVRPTSPGKFPAWGGLARTLATLATYPFLMYVTTRSRTYPCYPFLLYVPVPLFLI